MTVAELARELVHLEAAGHGGGVVELCVGPRPPAGYHFHLPLVGVDGDEQHILVWDQELEDREAGDGDKTGERGDGDTD